MCVCVQKIYCDEKRMENEQRSITRHDCVCTHLCESFIKIVSTLSWEFCVHACATNRWMCVHEWGEIVYTVLFVCFVYTRVEKKKNTKNKHQQYCSGLWRQVERHAPNSFHRYIVCHAKQMDVRFGIIIVAASREYIYILV